MRNLNQSGHSVARILMVSPVQNELIRRNKSRIFIAPTGEGVIDSVLFGGYRPIENFIEVATAAIAMAGLHDPTGPISLKPAYDHNVSSIFQQHLVSTGWLENDKNEVVDLVIEVGLAFEELPDINMTSYNGNPVDGYDDNPLCIFCDVQELYPQSVDFGGEDETEVQLEPIVEPTQETASAEGQPEAVNGGPQGQGRVKNPETDGRLKGNREMARRHQNRDEDGATSQLGRQAGKPGRVRDPRFDMRLSRNRGSAVQADAGGR